MLCIRLIVPKNDSIFEDFITVHIYLHSHEGNVRHEVGVLYTEIYNNPKRNTMDRQKVKIGPSQEGLLFI